MFGGSTKKGVDDIEVTFFLFLLLLVYFVMTIYDDVLGVLQLVNDNEVVETQRFLLYFICTKLGKIPRLTSILSALILKLWIVLMMMDEIQRNPLIFQVFTTFFLQCIPTASAECQKSLLEIIVSYIPYLTVSSCNLNINTLQFWFLLSSRHSLTHHV